jgi:hypothetical protein
MLWREGNNATQKRMQKREKCEKEARGGKIQI